MSTIEQFTAAIPAYLGFYEGKSRHTIRQKKYALSIFADFMGAEYPGEEITPEMILEFRRSLYGLEPNTITKYMEQLRVAFRFMLDAKLISGENPVHIAYVGREKYKPYDSLLTHEDIQRILRDSCPDCMTYRLYLRSRAMTLLCMTSGLRIAELLDLAPEDLDWDGGKAVVRHGKGDKRRLVPFHPIAQEALKKYMESGRKDCPDGLPVFVVKDKQGAYKKIGMRTAQYNISDYVEAVTGRTDVSPHDLRHSAASWWSYSGVPMREIQALLGHAHLGTTERYASLVAPDTAPVRRANAVMSLAFGRPESVEQQ